MRLSGRLSRAVQASLPFLAVAGCASLESIDLSLAREARLALSQERPPPMQDDEEFEPEEEAPQKSVLVAELLAIFPGLFWHGLGHQYAGDQKTAKELRKAGQWGYLLTAVGGGLAVGAYYLDESTDDWDGTVLSLYIAGGLAGGTGTAIFLTVWFYDMIDTPRAVRSGGRPPRRTPFTRDLEEFGED